MSLINEALNKSRSEQGAVQDKVSVSVSVAAEETAYAPVFADSPGREAVVGKRTTSRLSFTILMTILAGAIIFLLYNYNIIPHYGKSREIKIGLKDNIESAMLANVAISPEGIHDTAKEEKGKEIAAALPQVQDEELVKQAVSMATDLIQSAPEGVKGEEHNHEPAAPPPPRPRNDTEAGKIQINSVDTALEPQQASPEQRPNNAGQIASYHFRMAVFHQKNNEFQKAIKEYNKVVALGQDSVEVHINLGVIYKDMEDLDMAAQEYEKALAIDPLLEEGYNNLGVVYFLEGNYSEAIRQYQKTIEINPRNLESYVNLGVAYGIQKRSDEAVKAFQNALSIEPRHAEAQYNLAVIYDENGEIEKALDCYRKFLEFCPETTSASIDKVKRRIDVLSSSGETQHTTTGDMDGQ